MDLYPELYNALYSRDLLFQFRKMLNLGYYPHGNYNEEFIPGKEPFQKRYYSHDFILIGYDDRKQVFISVGYLLDQKFHRYSIAYEDMKKAVYSIRGPKIAYNFWKYNQEAKYELNISKLVTELSDYIQSTTSQKKKFNNVCLGMQAIHELGSYIVKTCSKENYIDLRYTRA